ncbi:DNA-3-methyladenine glycosylase 2 [Duganella sp. FT80W]|uniref:DNA-3-methyladenine glycosylase II n=1 Tax=Duganella guangzhouensis TaxID=2666084 RepID=A0A6I2L2Z1_9BURK|nr:DNA-3-methyladenine glycosylase 2 [Duganella guangzhouensis]MRW92162.1 DNA-3-methyladenine glycosylase 2 [Duganella guangzhouensis]
MKPYKLALPPDYRLDDVLAFHRRDAESIAEEVSAERLRKGVLLDGVPVVLDIALPPAGAGAEARVSVQADSPLSAAGREQAREAVLNILGLRIDPAPFCAFVKKDKLFGALARKQPGLRIVQSATVFEALTWAIIGQQINLSFAIALRRSFILQAGRQHSSGLWCYPDADSAAALSVDDLTSRKFSRAKAETLLRLATLVANGELRLELADDNSIDQISAALLAVKGIGPWTVNYGLLRGYGYADCSLHGDVAVRAALQTLMGADQRPDIKQTEDILTRYSPHRTMAAAHLWASLHPRD